MTTIATRPSPYLIFGHRPQPSHDKPHHNQPGRHAWVILGEKTIFLCHMIMGWMQGHNYEVVLEVDLPEDVVKKVLRDRSDNGHTHFLGNQADPPAGNGHGHAARSGETMALRPEHTIPMLFSGRLNQFTADIWNYFPAKQCSMEWPYPPRTAFLEGVPVAVRRVVHYRHINLNILAQRYESYLLFGRDEEAHIYHNVVEEPDYDHVATLAHRPDWIQPDQLEAGVIVSVPGLPWTAGRTHCTNPLPDGRTQRVLYHGYRRYRDHPPRDPNRYHTIPPLEIELGRTWFFSTRVVNWPGGPSVCGGLGDIPTPSWPPDARCVEVDFDHLEVSE